MPKKYCLVILLDISLLSPLTGALNHGYCMSAPINMEKQPSSTDVVTSISCRSYKTKSLETHKL
uniref:Secreted protein n=1 Tax=Romanomermis culicivorax TaxID=13658 RepID=A0A915JZ15_ROMCU